MDFYFKNDDLPALGKYKYSSIDDSIISKKILQPWWEIAIKFMPLWIAPNMITLLGLLWPLLNFAATVYYCPNFVEPTPVWLCISHGLGMFYYQTMDAIDGKQARRTSTGGPLGELFDHGCDALNTCLSCLAMAAMMRLGVTWDLAVFVICMQTAFYMSTWEEYHTGTLYLGVISGPVEGLLLTIISCFATAALGSEIWRYRVLGLEYLPLSRLMVSSLAVSVVGSVITSIRHAAASFKTPAHEALMQLYPMALLALLTAVWFFAPPNNRVGPLAHFPMLAFTVNALASAMLVGRVILGHLLHIGVPSTQGVQLVFVAGAANSLAHRLVGLPIVQHQTFVWVALVVVVAMYAHFAGTTCMRFAGYLNIRVLSIPH